MAKEQYWWEAEGLRFECLECGKCCGGEPGNIWVTDAEQERIAKYLCLDMEELRKRYLVRRMGRISIREKENMDCAFYECNSAHCLIYKVRPSQCSLFPFWSSLLKDKKIWNFYALQCPGMNRGKLYTKEIIFELLKASAFEDL